MVRDAGQMEVANFRLTGAKMIIETDVVPIIINNQKGKVEKEIFVCAKYHAVEAVKSSCYELVAAKDCEISMGH